MAIFQIKKNDPTPWKVLVVDDDPDVWTLTQKCLDSFRFDGKGIHLLFAESERKAREILDKEEDIAVALIDVVMETADSGLRLVEYIRNRTNNQKIRLVIRTAHPDQASEHHVINHYDIDDYKVKSELTPDKLRSTVRSVLKSYRDLCVVDATRRELEMILEEMPTLYGYPLEATERFYEDILERLVKLCRMDLDAESVWQGFACVVLCDGHQVGIQARVGTTITPSLEEKLMDLFDRCHKDTSPHKTPDLSCFPEYAILIPLELGDKRFGYIYLEEAIQISQHRMRMLRILVNHCAAAIENLKLHLDLRESHENSMRMLALAAEFKDSDTGDHLQRLSRQTYQVALEMGISEEEATLYAQASMMHDIGKIGIPDAILLKPGRLTKDEFEVIKSHPGIGATILDGDQTFDVAREVAVSHHEKWNGNGYPLGLEGDEIPVAARIVAVVDVFDALVSTRPYKKPWKVEDAIEEIKNCSGTHFDPKVVDAFMKVHHRRVVGRREKHRKDRNNPRRIVSKPCTKSSGHPCRGDS